MRMRFPCTPMMKRRLVSAAVIAIGCGSTGAVTWFVTWWIERDDARQYCREARDFPRYRAGLSEFASDHKLDDGDRIEADHLPKRLDDLGIVLVYRKGQCIHFVLRRTGFMADGTCEFVYRMGRPAGGAEEILKDTERSTTHLQQIAPVEPWFFWMHRPKS